VPAKVDPAIAARMQEYGLRLHRALGCRDYSRVDVMMDAHDSSLYLLECNTLPGLTSLSLFPEAAAAAGIAYEALIDRLVRAALSRNGVHAS
jgi:D-alanine-D-alanine ligase